MELNSIDNTECTFKKSVVDDYKASSYSSLSDENKQNEEDYDTENYYGYSCLRRFFGPIHEGSLRGAIIAIASITFGGESLSLPYAIAEVGPLLGAIILLISAFMCLITLNYLLSSAFHLKIMNYNSLIESTIGKKFRIVGDISNIIVCMGLFANYAYIINQLCLSLFEIFWGFEQTNITIKICCIIFFAITQILLSFIKDVSQLEIVSLAGTISMILSVIVIIIEFPFYLIEYLKTNTVELFPPKGVGLNFLDTIGIFIYGFAPHNGIFQILNSMHRAGRRRSTKVINRAFYLMLFTYFPLALAGFFSTFYKTPDVFLKRANLPGFKDYFIIVVNILVILTTNISIALNYNIMRLSVNSLFFNNTQPSNLKDRSIVIGVFIFSSLVTYFINNAGSLFSFLGGICSTVICFIIPILIDMKVDVFNKSTFRKVFNYFFLVLIIIIAVACTAKSGRDLIMGE